MNQTAQNLASKGRYGDTTLVHMSPQEVRGLQALARNNGTTLTINPSTGLPEAFNLGRLLPMVAGAGLTMLSGGTLSPLTVGLMTGGLGALATGSLKEGLMMGLGAAGGAGLAGSMANLAAPAATAAAPAGGAAGGTGLTVGAALPPIPPASMAPGATIPPTDFSLTSGASFPQTAGLQVAKASPPLLTPPSAPPLDFSAGAPSLSSQVAANTAPLGSYSTALPAQPDLTGLAPRATGFTTVDLTQRPPLDFDKALGPQMAGRYPAATDFSLSQKPLPPAGPSYGSRMLEGGKQAFGSMDAAGKFLEGNKMNLAMSAAPAMFAEPEYEGAPESNAMIRPYSLEIDNTSGIAASPVGREDERLRYRYTAGTPYRAAQGGIIAFAQGGNTTDGQELMTNPALRPFEEGMMLPPLNPQRLNAQKSMPAMGVPQGYAEGGQPKYRDVRKKINRMEDPYSFAAYQSGRGLYDAAMQNFAGGGLSNVPRFLSGGGDGMSDSIPATINDRQPARLADGEFVIPADVVSHLGNGSSKAGARQLYDMMDRVRSKRTGKKKQAPAVNSRKMMPA